jgi:hypothetical protein
MSSSTRRPSAKPSAVVARGGPRRLACAVPLEPGQGGNGGARRFAALLEGVEVERIIVFPGSPRDPDAVRLSAQVPSTTPPGRYRGSLHIDGRRVAFEAEVEPVALVSSDPERVVVDAAPRSTITARLSLLNVGNVTCDVPASSTFYLFDGTGFEHAFWAALASDPPPEKGRADLFFDDLADSHGALVRARVTRGGGGLVLGERRDVHLRMRFSERVRPGRTYVGAWQMEGLRMPVRAGGVEAEAQSRRNLAESEPPDNEGRSA